MSHGIFQAPNFFAAMENERRIQVFSLRGQIPEQSVDAYKGWRDFMDEAIAVAKAEKISWSHSYAQRFNSQQKQEYIRDLENNGSKEDLEKYAKMVSSVGAHLLSALGELVAAKRFPQGTSDDYIEGYLSARDDIERFTFNAVVTDVHAGKRLFGHGSNPYYARLDVLKKIERRNRNPFIKVKRLVTAR